MLFALRHPAVLLGLALGFVVGCALRVTLERLVLGDGARALQVLRQPRRWLDPFGTVAAVLAGVGWAPRQESGRRVRSRLWPLVAAAVVAHAVLAAAGLLGFDAVEGTDLLPLVGTVSVLHGSIGLSSVPAQVLLGFGVENLACGLLCLVPLPPLELGVAVWTSLPRSPGARRMAYHLLEEQWSVAILLVLLLLPLAGQLPALLALVGAVGDAILAAL